MSTCVRGPPPVVLSAHIGKPGTARAAGDLMIHAREGKNIPLNDMNRKVTTPSFLATHPVFSLAEAVAGLRAPGGKRGALDRLKHYARTGRLKTVARGIYAVIPPGAAAETFAPDPLLAALAARSDAIFCHHTALELLGVAQSAWRGCSIFTVRAGRPLRVGADAIRQLPLPRPMASPAAVRAGVRTVDHRGRLVKATGPEWTLVEGFRRPALVGGLPELVASASAFTTIDLDVLRTILRRYHAAILWAACGWFLERTQDTFHVPEADLRRFERHRPRSPQYLERGRRGGTFVARWNLIVPAALAGAGEPDER